MPLTIQDDKASGELARQFGLKGRVQTALDEIIVPVTIVGDFAGRSPYAPRGLVADSQTAGASGVGRNGGLFIAPAPGTVLVVEYLKFLNTTGVTQTLEIRVARPADVAAATIIGTSASVSLNGRMRTTGFAPQGMATSSTFHNAGAAVGALFDRVYSHSSDRNLKLRFPRGVILDGSDPLGPIRLAVVSTTANQATPYVSWYGTEYVVR